VVTSQDSNVPPHQEQQKEQQQRRSKQEPKHIELPPSGKDELLTYPGSIAADRMPDKGEVEVRAARVAETHLANTLQQMLY
jgi:hypothetical protein